MCCERACSGARTEKVSQNVVLRTVIVYGSCNQDTINRRFLEPWNGSCGPKSPWGDGRLRWGYIYIYGGQKYVVLCGTSLGLLSCFTYTRLHSVYNHLHHILVWIRPTPNFLWPLHVNVSFLWQLVSSWVFPFSLSPRSSIAPCWWDVSLLPHSKNNCIASRLTLHNTTCIW